jgi:hypothetical protein
MNLGTFRSASSRCENNPQAPHYCKRFFIQASSPAAPSYPVGRGSAQSGPKVAAILSVIESCRRLGVTVKDYLLAVLPGIARRKLSEVIPLTQPAGPLPETNLGWSDAYGYSWLLQVGKETGIAWGDSWRAKTQTAKLKKELSNLQTFHNTAETQCQSFAQTLFDQQRFRRVRPPRGIGCTAQQP